jgi:bacterial/archaeal transporter family-2 protein
MATLAVPLLLVVGGLMAVQAAANVQLATAMGSSTAASTLQLAVGATLLLALALAAGTAGALHQVPGVTPWHLLGGVASTLWVTAGIVLLPRLGAVVSVGLFVTGQVLASLLLDGLGLLGVRAKPVTIATLLGIAVVLAGAALIVRAQGGGAEAPSRTGLPRTALLLLAVLAGACLPAMGAINAQLRVDLRDPIAAGLFSFLVATMTMALVVLAGQAFAGTPAPRVLMLRRVPWWGWGGGFAGATYLVAVVLLIPVIGAAATVALTIAGQQLASVAVDRFGLLRLPRRPIGRLRLTGVAVLLIGVALLQAVD